MVPCEPCRRAELTAGQRFAENLLTLVGFEPAARVWWRACAPLRELGRTQYERHRAEYERTGDPMELERMLRHVKTP